MFMSDLKHLFWYAQGQGHTWSKIWPAYNSYIYG